MDEDDDEEEEEDADEEEMTMVMILTRVIAPAYSPGTRHSSKPLHVLTHLFIPHDHPVSTNHLIF